LCDDTIIDLGYGPSFALDQEDLHPVAWLLDAGKEPA